MDKLACLFDVVDSILPVCQISQVYRYSHIRRIEGKIGKLHDVYYATVGNGTSVANAKKYANAIGQELKQEKVDGIILTST